MSGQSGGQRVCLAKLNEQLTCKLCGGYFIDATTIIECLHSFCRSCIVKYLESNKYCPICEVQVHKNRPLLNIRPDHTLQDIVYKLVPGCYQNEMRCRREFYAKHPEICSQVLSPEARGEPVESHIYSPDESLSLSLEYFNPKDLSETNTGKSLLRRYFRCPAAVTVFHLQKLIRAKYGLSDANRVDIMYEEEPLCSSYSLMDIMYIYHWRRKVPLHLSYRIFEISSKRLKLSEDNANYKKSLMDADIDSIELKDDNSLKREWKEVQLKISETGVMSITDISSTIHKRDAEVENLQNEKISEETLVSSIADIDKVDSMIENCGISKSSVEIMQSTLIIDPQLTNDPIFSEASNAFLVTNDITFTNENSSTKNCTPLTNQHNGTAKQADETRNCTASAKLQQDAQEVKVHNQIANVEDRSETVSQKDIGQSATQFVEESVVIEDKEKMEARAKKMAINNNNNSADFQTEIQKECIKSSNEGKMGSAGSKIDALSVKLQFQPKMSQVNNTYSKKAPKEKRALLQQSTKKPDVKSSSDDTKLTDTKAQTNCENVTSKVSVSAATAPQKSIVSTMAPQNISDSLSGSDKQKVLDEKNNQSTSIDLQQALNLLEQRNSPIQSLTESAPKTSHIASMVSQRLPNNNITTISEDIVSTVPNVSTSTISQMASTFPYSLHDIVTNSAVLKSALKNSGGVPQKPLGTSPIVCSTSSNQVSPMPQFNMQTSSVNVYSIPTSMKNNYSNISQDVTTVTAASSAAITTAMSKPMSGACPIPPCPDAIPISLMKQMSMRKQDVTAKGTNLNEICAKIGSNTIGSKINDICAKIGENSKEKNRVDAHSKSDVPDLLRISAKKNHSPLLPNSDMTIKHIPNIPNVPVYTPSSNATTMENKSAKPALPMSTSTNVMAVSASSAPMSSHATQRLAPLKKPSPIGYKTLRDPPKSWNPTLSRNNYVAAKNQAKEMQNQTQLSMSEGTNKQIPSKPAKIFKMRNMPRYLGNPASGVKPMYGVTNDTKEKEQPTINMKGATFNMMKIDPKTLSPIVSTINSPIVSPPPYSPNARSYQNTFSRDICRNTGSPISPRNSPVNMLSTNPFIPSPTPNTNPRLIYSHFSSPFPDANRFPNPLIRSPIGIPPPSAFHSSLPPSINKLYQRSSYIPQTTGYVPVVGQPPTVQRIPPSTHSSSPKSPKASSPSSISSTSFNLGKAESQSPITSTVDNVAQLLSKSVTVPVPVPVSIPVPVPVSLQRELNAFNLSKTGGLSPSPTSNVKTSSTMDTNNADVEAQLVKSNSSSMSLNLAGITTSAEVSENSSSSHERKQSKETEARKAQEPSRCKEDNFKLTEVKCSIEIVADNATSLHNKKEKNQTAKINGDVTTEQFVNKKSKEAGSSDDTATTAEKTERDSQVERSSPKERNSIPKSNTQANIDVSPADGPKKEDLGKSGEQIQGNKSEVQKNKAET